MTFFTIKEMARLSGVSTRALRFYDEIDLLKPKVVGDNQYRYYNESQLMDLQQILFFKALGLSLAEIKATLLSGDYETIETLVETRKKLIAKVKHLNTLIDTCQKSIQHLRGQYIMSHNELFNDFDTEKQQEYEDYLKQKGLNDDDIDTAWQKACKRSDDESDDLHALCRDITKRLANAIEAGETPDSHISQALIKEHYDWVCHHWVPNRETYIGLATMYQEDNEFHQFYQNYHEKMVAFLSKAMNIYANTHLK